MLSIAVPWLLADGPDDTAGPSVAAQVPMDLDSSAPPLDTIRLTFDEPIDPASFVAADDVYLEDPQGFEVSPVTVTVVSGSGDTEFDLTFAVQNLRGDYELTVGPQILDVAGNPMNQDGDATNGESSDAYSGLVNFAPTVWSPPAGPEVLYEDGFESWSPAPPHWRFEAPRNGAVSAADTGDPHSGTQHLVINGEGLGYKNRAITTVDLASQSSETDLWLDFWAKSSDESTWIGTFNVILHDGDQKWRTLFSGDLTGNYAHYAFDLDQAIAAMGIDLASDGEVSLYLEHYHTNTPGFTQDIYLDDLRITADPTMALWSNLAVLSHSPVAVADDAGPLDTVRLTFSEEVDTATFTVDDIELKDPQGVEILPLTLTPVAGSGNTEFDITFAAHDLRGDYRLTVGPMVFDMDGNPMNQDGDYFSGGTSDVYTATIPFEPTVDAVPSPPETVLLTEGFETWPSVPTHWSFHTVDNGTISVLDTDANSGTNRLHIQPATTGTNTQWITMGLDLAAHETADDLYLEFYAKPHGPGNFTIYPELSNDGVSWLTLPGLANPANGYNRYVVDIGTPVSDSPIVSLTLPVQLRLRVVRPSYTYTPSVSLDDIRLVSQDLSGPKVLGHTPVGLGSSAGPFNTITVEFDEAIGSFDPSDVVLKSPLGQSIAVDSIAPVPGSGGTQFTIHFADQMLRGDYVLDIGPSVEDLAGNVMNQDGDYLLGETADRYSTTIAFAPTIGAPNAAPNLFAEGFDWPPVATCWRFDRDANSTFALDKENAIGGLASLTSSLAYEWNFVDGAQSTIWTVDLSAQVGRDDLFVEFWAKKYNASGDLHVDISTDGATWYNSVFSSALTTDYQPYGFDLDAAAANNGVDIDDDIYLRFRHRNTHTWSASTLWLDEVQIIASSPMLSVAVSDVSLREDAGPAATMGYVRRSASMDVSSEVVVTLAVDDPSEAAVPATVTIPAGEIFASFPIDIVDDALLDGTQVVSISAVATGFGSGIATLNVTDHEMLAIQIDRPSIAEADAPTSTIATLTRSNVDDMSSPLTVDLWNDRPGEANVPSPVTIPADKASVSFTISAIDDGIGDGPQLVTITPDVAGYLLLSDSVYVEDSQGDKLSVGIPLDTINEAAGALATTATVSRTGDTTAALDVVLASSSPNNIHVPPSVTIPAGETSADFDVFVVNDPDLDGLQTVRVTAYAADYGLVQGWDTIDVEDDDVPATRTIGGYLPGPITGGPYHVLTNLMVAMDRTLTIEPGAELRFAADTAVLVDGLLEVQGTNDSRIVFTTDATVPAKGDWAGVQLTRGSQPRTVLDYVEIEFAQTGLSTDVDRPSFTLSNSSVHDCAVDGVYVYAGYGKHVSLGDVIIVNNEVYSNDSAGILLGAKGAASSTPGKLSSTNAAQVARNEIHSNAWGLDMSAVYHGSVGYAGSASCSPTVSDNLIRDNTAGGVRGAAFESAGVFGDAIMSGLYTNNLITTNGGNGVTFTRTYNSELAITFINNTIAHNLGAGFWHDPLGSYACVQNNIIAENNVGMNASAAWTPIAGQITHNDVWANSNGNWYNYPAEFGTATTSNGNGTPADAELNISQDPQFRTDLTGAESYRVQWMSPCIDAGSDTGAPADDYTSRARVLPTDIGAYESHAIVLQGTDSSEAIMITPGAIDGVWHQVEIGGAATSYDPAVYDEICIDGLGGSDTITIHGTDENEVASLQPGSVDFQGESYEVHAISVETITVDANVGDDQVTMTGSSGSNRLYSYVGYAKLADSPRTFSYQVNGFNGVAVNAPAGGRNYAFLYDSLQDDVLDANPTRVVLNRAVGTADATITTATGFQRAYAYGASGGTDSATLTGSDTTRNRFYGYADYSMLTESRRSFYFYARGFDTVTANSPGSGYTYAYLHDSSGIDALTASPASATMDRAVGWSDTMATGFKRVYAYSTRGGDDTATLTGNTDGGNNLRAYPTNSTLTDRARTFYHYVRGFRSVEATGSTTDTSSDRAYLYDSSGADTLVGSGHSAILGDTLGTTYEIDALYFDLVYARSSDGAENDTVVEDSIVYNLIRSGVW